MADLVGLVFIDWLRLSPIQWGAIILHAAGWLWVFHSTRRWTITGCAGIPVLSGVEGLPASFGGHFYVLLTAVLTLSGLWVSFWNKPICVDPWLNYI